MAKNKRKRIDGYILENKDMKDRIKDLNIDELDTITDVDFRFKKIIVKFANFLRNEGFSISVDALLKFFKLYKNFDIFEIEDTKLTLKMLFVKNKEQHDVFEDYFNTFFNTLSEIKVESYINKLARAQYNEVALTIESEKAEEINKADDLINSLEERKSIIESEVEIELAKINDEKSKLIDEYNNGTFSYNRKKESNEESIKDWLNSNNENLENVLNSSKLNELQKKNSRMLLSLSQDDIMQYFKDDTEAKFEQAKMCLNEIMMTNIIGQNDSNINELCLTTSNVIVKLKTFIDKKNKEFKEQISSLNKSISTQQSKINMVNIEINNANLKRDNTIRNYDNKINSISKDIEKELSKVHRAEFIGGKNSVRTRTNKDLLNSDIEKLNANDYESLTDIIKANSSAFKTRISQSMIRHKSKKFNYAKTMSESLKTFGVPFELCYEKPKLKKTKVICILDVSGSCSKSSKLLLRFIYELSDVFKGGVKSYAFVKDLADISDYFINYHINDAIENSLKSVPRTYSDYHYALRTFNELYLGEVTKDTIVLFLGDARNNNNPTGEEYLNNIKNKAKSVIWLNTEEKPKWDTNDSIIGVYSNYLNDVYEILTTNNLIEFLETIRIN